MLAAQPPARGRRERQRPAAPGDHGQPPRRGSWPAEMSAAQPPARGRRERQKARRPGRPWSAAAARSWPVRIGRTGQLPVSAGSCLVAVCAHSGPIMSPWPNRYPRP